MVRKLYSGASLIRTPGIRTPCLNGRFSQVRIHFPFTTRLNMTEKSCMGLYYISSGADPELFVGEFAMPTKLYGWSLNFITCLHAKCCGYTLLVGESQWELASKQ